MREAREFTIDDLPRFSPWPARLLGLEPWEPRLKTPAEVTREFDGDKWGSLLARCRAAGGTATLSVLEQWVIEADTPGLCSVGERFELLLPRQALTRHYEVIARVLQRMLPASAIVELGAGYGGVVLKLAGDLRFRGVALIAAEYTNSGVALLKMLAAAAEVDLQIGHCDLRADPVSDLVIPEGAIIFTSMAAHYIPQLDQRFVLALSRPRPKVVVHFEPCYEHCDPRTLTGAMRRRYIEVNDYNRNLVSLLREHSTSGTIRIVEESPAVIGVNPLLPISVVAWSRE